MISLLIKKLAVHLEKRINMKMPVFTEHAIEANDIAIHYLEMGTGYPLLLLHGGTTSTSSIWKDHRWGMQQHLATFAANFHVYALDTRGHGSTSNPTQTFDYHTFAQDVVAFIDALHLNQPFIYGFSDGGITASLIAIHYPNRLGALVNHAGCDMFMESPPVMPFIKALWGGSDTATEPDFTHIEQTLLSSEWLEHIKRDHAVNEDAWKTHIRGMFRLWTTPLGVPVADFSRISVPCLLMLGDRDQTHELEDFITAYHYLAHGALAVMPNTAHAITQAVCVTAIQFLQQVELEPNKGSE